MIPLADRLNHLKMALHQDGRGADAELVREAIAALKPASEAPLERHAIVALMGHRQVAGRVSEELFAGTPMCRVDIPLADGSFSTRLFGGAALYEVTYVTEEVARAVAARNPAHPVSVWSARSLGLLAAHTVERDPAEFIDEAEAGDEGPF